MRGKEHGGKESVDPILTRLVDKTQCVSMFARYDLHAVL